MAQKAYVVELLGPHEVLLKEQLVTGDENEAHLAANQMYLSYRKTKIFPLAISYRVTKTTKH